MKCSCPKCSSDINVDEPTIPEKGNFSRCPDCNSRFWLHREPFLLRAYKKDWKAFCHHCGEEIGSASYCESCYQPFPDYWVVQKTRPARRKSTYKADISISMPGFSFRKTKTVENLDLEPDSQTDEYFDSEPEERSNIPRKPIMVFGLVTILVIALFFGGKEFFKGDEQQALFTKEYITALYSVTAGADIHVEKLTQLASGKALTAQETNQLQKMKAKLDTYRKKISKPPTQFVKSVDDFESIYRAYLALHSLAVSTTVVPADFEEQVNSLKEKLDQAEQNLSSGLPEGLREAILEASTKYQSLKFIGGE